MKLQKLNELCEVGKVFISDHKTSICIGTGIAGMFTAGVLAVKVTPKASMLLEERRCKKHEAYNQNTEVNPKLTIKDYIQVTWKYYLPPIVLAGASAGMIIFAHKLDTKENAALAAAYALSESRLKEYTTKTLETVGERKEKEIRNAIDKDRVDNTELVESEVIHTGDGETLCLDAWSGRYFYSDIEILRREAVELSRSMLEGELVLLNDWYDAIHLDTTKVGDKFGWEVNQTRELIELNYSSQLNRKNQPVLVVDFKYSPAYNPGMQPW